MASLIRRVAIGLLRSPKQRGGHGWPGGSFWAEGTQTGRNGYLFGETPPPPGHKRKWESWEVPFYVTYGACFLIAVAIVNGPQEHTLPGQAKPVAIKEIEEEDEIFAAFAADKEFQEAVAKKFLSEGKHPDRFYDFIMLRREFEVLKAAHSRQHGTATL